MDRSWEYINRSQTHGCGNGDWGRAIPVLGTHKWDFRCSLEFAHQKERHLSGCGSHDVNDMKLPNII